MQAILISIIGVLGAGLIGFITTVVHGLRADTAQLRDQHANLRTELKADNAELRAELKADNAELRTELKADNAELRTELKADNAELRAELSRLVETVHGLANKMVTAMADLEIRLGHKLAAEIRKALQTPQDP
ncbi:hypothetical protein [Candidatus Poriferisocius sp.]|uniref:hypothetical protein n=1 Tax=Candidatus Poriferisocius sp. TaxID=3101276 RepID=UPI003B01E530